MGAGFCGRNGTGPEVGKHLMKIYVTPRLKYGLKALRLRSPETKKMEDYYRNYLRMLQYMHQTTAKPAVYLLVGVLPNEAQLDVNVICIMASML